MPEFCNFSRGATGMVVLSAILCALMPVSLPAAPAATIVSDQVHVMHTGFGRNRATNVWTATLKVTNTSSASINGPVNVMLTNLSGNAAMVNQSGAQNGKPYIMASPGPLAPGATASVLIQFTNSTNGFINFTPVTYSGGF